MSHFTYDESTDTYTCPEGQTLTTNGNWYKTSKDRNNYTFKHYKTNACGHMRCKSTMYNCGKRKKKLVERSEYAPYILK